MQLDCAHQPERDFHLCIGRKVRSIPSTATPQAFGTFQSATVLLDKVLSQLINIVSLAKDRLSSTYNFRGSCGVLGQSQYCAIVATIVPLTDDWQTVGLQRRL